MSKNSLDKMLEIFNESTKVEIKKRVDVTSDGVSTTILKEDTNLKEETKWAIWDSGVDQYLVDENKKELSKDLSKVKKFNSREDAEKLRQELDTDYDDTAVVKLQRSGDTWSLQEDVDDDIEAAKQDSIEKGLYTEARKNPEQNWDNRLNGDRYSSVTADEKNYDIKRNRVSSKQRADDAMTKLQDKNLSDEMKNNLRKKSSDMKTYEVNPNQRSNSFKLFNKVAKNEKYDKQIRDEAKANADSIYRDMKSMKEDVEDDEPRNGTDRAVKAIQGYFRNGELDLDWLLDNIELYMMNDEQITNAVYNKRSPAHSAPYMALLKCLNDQGYGELSSSQVKAGFKKLGLDFKEILKPMVDKVDELRNEGLNEASQQDIEFAKKYVNKQKEAFAKEFASEIKKANPEDYMLATAGDSGFVKNLVGPYKSKEEAKSAMPDVEAEEYGRSIYQVKDLQKLLNESVNLTEDDDDEETDYETSESNALEQEQDQEENPVEEENTVDTQLNELREVLPDLELSLYQLIDENDKNNIIYIVGKYDEDNDEILMLSQTNTENDENQEPTFDFVKLPSKYEQVTTLAPIYGEGLTPNHEAVMDYLMKQLIEVNPDKAEELNDENVPVPDEVTGEEAIEDEEDE